MIEKTIIDYLKGKMSVPVYMEVPENPSGQFVVIEKTAGGLTNHIYTAMLAIQSYAPSLLEAAELNEAVKEEMLDAIELDEICHVDLNSDYNFTDVSTKQYRYQAVFDITHY